MIAIRTSWYYRHRKVIEPGQLQRRTEHDAHARLRGPWRRRASCIEAVGFEPYGRLKHDVRARLRGPWRRTKNYSQVIGA